MIQRAVGDDRDTSERHVGITQTPHGLQASV
jgi:hypothetical protein